MPAQSFRHYFIPPYPDCSLAASFPQPKRIPDIPLQVRNRPLSWLPWRQSQRGTARGDSLRAIHNGTGSEPESLYLPLERD